LPHIEKAVIVNTIILLFNLFYDKMMMWIGENKGKYKSKELLINDIAEYLILIKMISSISNVY
jgi:hypothetical protein